MSIVELAPGYTKIWVNKTVKKIDPGNRLK